jgi:hypothetical protein
MHCICVAKKDYYSKTYTLIARFDIFLLWRESFTYDHRIMRTRLPVRSALFKHDTGGLVVKWVTISESLLLYVFAILLVIIYWKTR